MGRLIAPRDYGRVSLVCVNCAIPNLHLNKSQLENHLRISHGSTLNYIKWSIELHFIQYIQYILLCPMYVIIFPMPIGPINVFPTHDGQQEWLVKTNCDYPTKQYASYMPNISLLCATLSGVC